MMNLKSNDLQTLHHVGEAAFRARSMQDLCEDTLRITESAVNASSSVFFDINDTCEGIKFQEMASRGVPSKAPELWCEEYQPQDPFVLTMIKEAKVGNLHALASHDLIRHREYINSDFYNIFLKPQSIYHVMVVGLMRNDTLLGLMGFHRPLGAAPFSKRDIEFATLTSPQIATAVEAIKNSDACKSASWLADTLVKDAPYEGVVILNNHLDIIYISEVAKALLSPSPEEQARFYSTGMRSSSLDIKHMNSSQLDSLVSSEDQKLIPVRIREECRKMLGQLNKGSTPKDVIIPLSKLFSSRHFNTTDVEVSIRPVEHGPNGIRFMLFLGQPSNELVLKERVIQFRLTKREEEIVKLVSAGRTNPEVAQELNISIRTVQNHLRSIYEKVGVHNRTSLFYQLAIKN